MNAALNRILDFFLGTLDLFRFWVVLYEYERGVILRLGRPNRDLGPGIHWRAPFKLEELRFLNVKQKTTNSWDMTFSLHDGTTIAAGFACIIKVIDARHVLLNVDTWENTAYTTIKIAVSEKIRENGKEPLLQIDFVDTVFKHVNEALKKYGLGLVEFGFQDMALCRAYKLFEGSK